MIERKMNDLEIFEKKRKNILELERKIQNLQEVKEIKKLQQEERYLKSRIKNYAIYDSVQIGTVIAKLMTSFEGIEYCCSKIFLDYDYCIEPKLNNRNDMYIYPSYQINNIRKEKYSFTCDRKDRCYLLPSCFKSNSSRQTRLQNTEIQYIQLFIDYVYERRLSRFLEEICEIDLEEILQEFLEVSKELQQQRKEEIKSLLEERLAQRKHDTFEKSCLIDRKLIFNSLAYIINHYELHMNATQETEKKWIRINQWSELNVYHKLTVQLNNKQAFFITKVDSRGCYPDEEYCGLYVDVNKNTDICFFDIKEALLPILNSSNYALHFMSSIEEMYLEKQKITSEDIQPLLINIINDWKAKQRVLKKSN